MFATDLIYHLTGRYDSSLIKLKSPTIVALYSNDRGNHLQFPLGMFASARNDDRLILRAVCRIRGTILEKECIHVLNMYYGTTIVHLLKNRRQMSNATKGSGLTDDR